MDIGTYMDLRPAIERDIALLIDRHPVLGKLPEIDKLNAAKCAADDLLFSVRWRSIGNL